MYWHKNYWCNGLINEYYLDQLADSLFKLLMFFTYFWSGQRPWVSWKALYKSSSSILFLFLFLLLTCSEILANQIQSFVKTFSLVLDLETHHLFRDIISLLDFFWTNGRSCLILSRAGGFPKNADP